MSSDVAAALIGAVLGAALTLLAEPIRYYLIDRPRVRRDLAPALRDEAQQVCKLAVLTRHSIRARHGAMTVPEIQWELAALDRLNDNEARNFATKLRELLPDAAALHRYHAQYHEPDPTRAGRIAALEVPFFDAHVHQLSTFSAAAQEACLRFRSEVRLFNGYVVDLRDFIAMTFDDGITGENRRRVGDNIRQTQCNLVDRAEFIAAAFEEMRIRLRLE